MSARVNPSTVGTATLEQRCPATNPSDAQERLPIATPSATSLGGPKALRALAIWGEDVPFEFGGILRRGHLVSAESRWRLAGYYARRGRKPPHNKDYEWIMRGVEFASGLLACRSVADRAKLAVQMPDIDAAFRLSRSRFYARQVLERGLLDGRSIPDIAADCGLTPGVVTAYEGLFFSVSGRLREKELIDALRVKTYAL